MRGQHPPKKPAPQDWHKADIKAELEKSGWSIRRLAAHHHLTESTLRGALEHSYPASERRIAKAIGVLPQTIWPSRYDADGQPTGKRGRRSVVAHPQVNRSAAATRGRAKGASSN